MTYQFEAGRIYRMPTHFGPAPGPRQIPDDVGADPRRSPRRLSVSASFLTDPAGLEHHLPEDLHLLSELIDIKKAKKLIEDFKAGNNKNANLIWRLFTLNHWMKQL